MKLAEMEPAEMELRKRTAEKEPAEMGLRKGNLWKGNLREGNCGKGIAEKELWKLKFQAMLPACEGLVRPFKFSQPLQV